MQPEHFDLSSPVFLPVTEQTCTALLGSDGAQALVGLTNPEANACTSTEECAVADLRWADGEPFRASKYPSLNGMTFESKSQALFGGALFKLFGPVSVIGVDGDTETRYLCEFTL